jgi:predicted transcriptional regulator
MRVHVILDDDLVAELDELAGDRGRSAFIQTAVRERVERERRWRLIRSAVGTIAETGHPWDPDPASAIRRARADESAARDGRLLAAWERGS